MLSPRICETPLKSACSRGHIEIVRLLLTARAATENGSRAASVQSETALLIAAGKGFAEIVQLLLLASADVDWESWLGTTALLVAAEAGHTSVVRFLLADQADASMADSDGDTALMHAATEAITASSMVLGVWLRSESGAGFRWTILGWTWVGFFRVSSSPSSLGSWV